MDEIYKSTVEKVRELVEDRKDLSREVLGWKGVAAELLGRLSIDKSGEETNKLLEEICRRYGVEPFKVSRRHSWPWPGGGV